MDFISDKVKQIPPYLFSELQKVKKRLLFEGKDVVDLSIGAPDLPTPTFIVDRLCKEARETENHRYSAFSGSDEFKKAVASFYQKEYGVELDPYSEVLTLVGSKEGIVNLVQTVINPGDTVFVPNPGYPAYRTAVHLADGVTKNLPLDADKNYQPKWDSIGENDKRNAKLMLLNYPNNPTAATVNIDTFKKAIQFGKENNVFIAQDSAYNLIQFNGYTSPSILQVEGSKEIAVEFGSLSKNFNMTGWRIGYVVGNKGVIKALATLKSNIDTSQFLAIQKAAAEVLESDLSFPAENSLIFEERMNLLYKELNKLNFEVKKPRGTIFLWVKVPHTYTSSEFANLLLEKAHIIVTPGNLFGSLGEGYIRIALTVNKDRLHTVIKRLKKLNV